MVLFHGNRLLLMGMPGEIGLILAVKAVWMMVSIAHRPKKVCM